MKTSYSIKIDACKIAVADLMPDTDGVEPDANIWWINRINVPVGFQGKGIGSSLLQQILDDADNVGAKLALTINPYGLLTYEQLRDWYERHGFEEDHDGIFVREAGKKEP